MEKTVTSRELDFLKRASLAGVAPQITKFKVTTKRYPLTLCEYIDGGGELARFSNAIFLQIQTLHALGILHGDLHSNNIVVDPVRGDVKIIDFGRSYLLEEVDNDVLEELTIFLEPEQAFQTLDDLLTFEYTMYLRDLSPEV